MNKPFPAETCFNCGRTEAQAPVSNWKYQGQQLWVCSECMPLLIHKLDEVMAVWQATPATDAEAED